MKRRIILSSVLLVASIQWVAGQPVISKQPTNTSVSLGATALFAVTVNAVAPPTTYRWGFINSELDTNSNRSAATRALSLTNVTVADVGPCFVVATDQSGSVTSQVATLTVDSTFVKITDPDITKVPADMWNPYWVDLDGDSWLELVVAGGFWTSGGKPLLVYENNRDGTLSRSLANDLSRVSMQYNTIAWADLDNDGDLDGFCGVQESETPVLFRNEGGGHFTRIVANRWWTANGIAVAGSVAGCADYDNDGILDLLAGYWGSEATGAWGTNRVLHGLGGGRFEVDLNSPLALSRTWVEHWDWADWNADGLLDLFGATSGNANQVDVMFENLGGGQFLRITNSPLVKVPDLSINAAWGDYDNDGDLDVLVTSWSRTNQLYR
ncbi:hypothetical protein EG834_13600, partial [bacterium]|nr:hypothetical protein [bacterium]